MEARLKDGVHYDIYDEVYYEPGEGWEREARKASFKNFLFNFCNLNIYRIISIVVNTIHVTSTIANLQIVIISEKRCTAWRTYKNLR